MARTLLVGLDGTRFSQFATDMAIRFARQSSTTLVGVGVIDEPRICKGEAVPIGGGYFKVATEQRHLQFASQQIEQFHEEFAKRCAQGGVQSKVRKLTGTPWEQITVEAQRVDAIVLGMETHFHFETENEPCDTLAQTIKHAPRPVIAVSDSLPEGNSVAIAYDGSLQAARMLSGLWASGFCDGVDVHVVSIHDDLAEASRRLDRAADFLRAHDVKVTAHPIAGGQFAAILLERAEALNAGLIAMGAYGQSTLREFFVGSVTKTMLQKSRVPLFLCH